MNLASKTGKEKKEKNEGESFKNTEIVWKKGCQGAKRKKKRHRHLILKYKKLWAGAGGVFKPPWVIDEPVKATFHQVVGSKRREGSQ